MVLLLSLSFGTNKTSEHSEGAGSGYVICHSERIQDQYRDNNREFDNEVPRRKQERGDPSPSNNYDFMLEGWSERELGSRRRSSFDITTLTNRSE